MLQCHTRPFLYNFSVGRARKNGIGLVEWFLVLFWGYFPWYFNSSFLCDLFSVVSDVNLLLLTSCKKLDGVFQVCLLRNFFFFKYSYSVHSFFLFLKVRIHVIGLLRSDRCSWIKAPLFVQNRKKSLKPLWRKFLRRHLWFLSLCTAAPSLREGAAVHRLLISVWNAH